MNIKKAGDEDVRQLAVLFDAYRVFYGMETDIKGAIKFLQERISRLESHVFISVNEKDLFTGFVQLYPLYSSTRMKRLWLLNDLYVHPEYRGQGISKKLIEASKKLSRLTNACGLLLETAKSNRIANNLYLASEFELDREHNFYFWDSLTQE